MAESLNTSLMLDTRFPRLSTLLYVQYAHETEKYFDVYVKSEQQSDEGLSFIVHKNGEDLTLQAEQLSEDEKIEVMNGLAAPFFSRAKNREDNPSEYVKINALDPKNRRVFIAIPNRQPTSKISDDFKVNYGQHHSF